MAAGLLARASGALFDFVLPARCAGCGDVVGMPGEFCPECWGRIDWLGATGCTRCAIPLEGVEQGVCLACETKPPLVECTVAAVKYDETTRALALKLKYGRRVGLAKVMGRAMARNLPSMPDALVAPVPLHRSRLWRRGFNQAGLLAREVAGHLDAELAADLLVRRRVTRPMVNMTVAQRERNVRGAMALRPGKDVTGRTILLVDDVRTSGATLEACAKALLNAGAGRVEALLWARVVRPRDITR